MGLCPSTILRMVPLPPGGGTLRETAYAKINLALHVRRRREDGYHELETLFAFVDVGDELTARRSDRDKLQVVGEFAPEIPDPFGNLVSMALSKLARLEGLSITLEKNLPVAAGLGGGSADAGAVFRLIRDAYGLPDDWRERAASLGADVPACVESLACIGRGTGTELDGVENDLAGTAGTAGQSARAAGDRTGVRRVGRQGSRTAAERSCLA